MHDTMPRRGLLWTHPAGFSGRVMRAFGFLTLAFMLSGCAGAAVALPIAWDVVTTTIGIVQRKTANESLQSANEQLRRTVQALEQIRVALDPEYRTERAKMEWRRTEWFAQAVQSPQAPLAADDEPSALIFVRLEQTP